MGAQRPHPRDGPVALAAGIVLHATGAGHAADVLWTVVLIAVIVPLAFTVVRRMLHGQLGADVIALLAIAGSLRWVSSRRGSSWR